jgi:hypothetical protein
MTAQAKGLHFISNIKDVYPCVKISDGSGERLSQ